MHQVLTNVEARFQTKIGYVYALIGNFGICLMALLIKLIPNVPTGQTIFFRSFILVTMNFSLMKQYNIESYSNKAEINRQLHLRGIVGIFGLGSFFYGIALLPISEGIVLNLTSPVLTGIIAKFVLGEKYEISQFITAVLCLIGVVLVVKPSFLFVIDENLNIKYDDYKYRQIGTISMLLSALCMSTVSVMIRKIGSKCSTITISQYNGFYGVVMSSILMIFQGQKSLILNELLLLICIGCAACFIQLCITRAFLFEKAGKVSIMNYTQIVISMIIDFFLMDFVPDTYGIIGSLLISSSIIALIKNNFYK